MFIIESTTFSDDESYESICSSESSFDEESDENNYEGFALGYVGEPEYNKDELQLMKFPSVGSNSDESENELNSSSQAGQKIYIGVNASTVY